MIREHAQQNPEEIKRGTQITDPDLARQMAEIEKPIRDLSRDPDTSSEVKMMKLQLDQEAERLSTKEEITKEKLLKQPINEILLSSDENTEALYSHLKKWATRSRNTEPLNTVYDLTQLGFSELLHQLGGKYNKELALDVEDWLKTRGLKLKDSSTALDRKNRNL
jgi:hypothetical protein